MAIVRAWGGALGFVKGWRGGHTVSLGRCMTVVRTWCGLLCFMEHGRVDDDACLLGAVGGEMCGCGLCGVVLLDQGPGRECGEIMTGGGGRRTGSPGCRPLGVGKGAAVVRVVSFCVWVAEKDAGGMAPHIVKGIEGPSES